MSMNKRLVGLAMIVLFACSASAQNWFKGSLDGALAKAKSENKKVLIDFFSGG